MDAWTFVHTRSCIYAHEFEILNRQKKRGPPGTLLKAGFICNPSIGYFRARESPYLNHDKIWGGGVR